MVSMMDSLTRIRYPTYIGSTILAHSHSQISH